MSSALDLVPTLIDVPASQRGEASFRLRYEDITEDGRLSCRAMTNALGATLWEKVLLTHPSAEPLGRAGILPILSRVYVSSVGRPIGYGSRPTTRGGFAVMRARDGKGRARFRLDMNVAIDGKVGHTHPPQPPNAGESIVLGRVHAEHVLTRLFAAPSERRVDALPEGVAIDGDTEWREAEVSATPAGEVRWLDADFVPDASETVFGLGHTDSNHHVNSLVYPLAIEEAALRRGAGVTRASFAHHFELAFRKPFFAGERMRVELRAYERGDVFGVVARLVDIATSEPRTFGRLELVS